MAVQPVARSSYQQSCSYPGLWIVISQGGGGTQQPVRQSVPDAPNRPAAAPLTHLTQVTRVAVRLLLIVLLNYVVSTAEIV
jgi:hypothetical protein